VPPAELLAERTPHMLARIYSVFTEGYWSTIGPSAIRDELCDEGVRLAGELCSLMPDERDAYALAAFVLLHDSRRTTRVDGDGALVQLDEQDRSRWDRDRIARGLDHLRLAAGARGAYLPQAVIAAIHATAPSWKQTDWDAICTTYGRLIEITGSPVARGEPHDGGRVPRRRRRRAGRAGEGRARSAAGAFEPRRVGTRRSAAPRQTPGRGGAVVSNGVGRQRAEPGRNFLRRRIAQCGG
jgi:RNA polymerase sigma-70 factor (ECF subfamily)